MREIGEKERKKGRDDSDDRLCEAGEIDELPWLTLTPCGWGGLGRDSCSHRPFSAASVPSGWKVLLTTRPLGKGLQSVKCCVSRSDMTSTRTCACTHNHTHARARTHARTHITDIICEHTHTHTHAHTKTKHKTLTRASKSNFFNIEEK